MICKGLWNAQASSKTDIVNRAISLYEYLDARLSRGDELSIRNEAGQVEQIKFF